MGVNVNVIGRLGKDAEIVKGQSGNFLSFSLATEEYKNKTKGTAWLRVSTDKTALEPWLKKGKLINVVGTETVDIYQDKEGKNRIDRNIRASQIDFVNVRSERENPPKETATGVMAKPQVNAEVAAVASATDDNDLPF